MSSDKQRGPAVCLQIGLRCCISHALATQELDMGYAAPQESDSALEGEVGTVECTDTWLSRLSEQVPAGVQVLTMAGLRPRCYLVRIAVCGSFSVAETCVIQGRCRSLLLHISLFQQLLYVFHDPGT